MNFTFADISSMYMNMAQSDLPKDVRPEPRAARMESQDAGNQAFAQKLSKTLENEQPADQVEIFASKIQDNEKVTEFLSKELEQASGSGFAAALKNVFLMLSKGDLKNISLDSEGLEALKKILVKAGFKESDIEELILELSENGENSEIPVDAFFDGLFKLTAEEGQEIETDNQSVFLEISTIPVLESILNSLGLSQEKIQDIISKADNGQNGVSLNEVIEGLKSVQKEGFYNHTQYQAKPDDENIRHILSQLGIKGGTENATSFSLDDLVASLESMRKEMSSQSNSKAIMETPGKQSAGQESQELLSSLFKGLKIKNESVEKPAFEFSVQQIKDQFESGLIGLSEDALSSKVKAGSSGPSLKEVFKEMAAMFEEQKNSQPLEKNTLLKDAQTSLKQMKNSETKVGDVFQASVSDLKSSDSTVNVSTLKSNTPLKNLPNFVTNQVSKSLVRAINQGENTLRIQLKPPELGRLMMTIDNSGSTMKVSILTESLAARDILTSNATELKSVLSNSGVNLERVEVDMSSDFRQSMADAKNQAGNFSRRRQNREKAMAGENNIEGINDAAVLEALNQDGSLHYVA